MMTYNQVRDVLMFNANMDDPQLWAAYKQIYGGYHSLDPERPQAMKVQQIERRNRLTERFFDSTMWARCEFKTGQEISSGYDGAAQPLNKTYFATEEAAEYLADQLDAIAYEYTKSAGPFLWPPAWYLRFANGEFGNAGMCGLIWNKGVVQYQRAIRYWNRNLGENNPALDPETVNPRITTIARLFPIK